MRRRTALALAAGAGGALALGAAARARMVAVEDVEPPGLPADIALLARERTCLGADGTRLHAVEIGPERGDALVLVHGWTCASEHWHHQLRHFAAQGRRVVAYDLRGHGRSEEPPGNDFSIEAFADDLGAVLDEVLGGGERALVVGHSMGAMSAAAYAHRHPDHAAERLVALALLNTGLGGLIEESLIVRTPTGLEKVEEWVGQAILSARSPLLAPRPVVEAGVRAVAFGPGAERAEVELLTELVIACRPHVRAGCGGTLSTLDLHHAAEAVRVPTTIVAGSHDRLTPPVHAERLAQAIEGSRLVVLEGVGHVAAQEAPSEVNAAIEALLEPARPRASAAGAGIAQPSSRSE